MAITLTRKVGQAIWIEYGLVKITVAGIYGRQVELRFEGNVQVDRQEVAEEKLRKLENADDSHGT
ncbi:MAG: carbon storage regulator [Bdellovibrionales bacterium]